MLRVLHEVTLPEYTLAVIQSLRARDVSYNILLIASVLRLAAVAFTDTHLIG